MLRSPIREDDALVESRTVALRAGPEHHGSFDERPDVGLHRVDVLGQHRLLDLRIRPSKVTLMPSADLSRL